MEQRLWAVIRPAESVLFQQRGFMSRRSRAWSAAGHQHTDDNFLPITRDSA